MFKDTVKADRLEVFLNINEFGEIHTVEGKPIPIVIDNDELKERQSGQDIAVAESSTLFYARTEDLPRRRPAGENININGRECMIDDWQEDMGLSTIVLHQSIPM